jgi:hypothetical protein
MIRNCLPPRYLWALFAACRNLPAKGCNMRHAASSTMKFPEFVSRPLGRLRIQEEIDRSDGEEIGSRAETPGRRGKNSIYLLRASASLFEPEPEPKAAWAILLRIPPRRIASAIRPASDVAMPTNESHPSLIHSGRLSLLGRDDCQKRHGIENPKTRKAPAKLFAEQGMVRRQ